MTVSSILASIRRASTAVRSVQYALPGRQSVERDADGEAVDRHAVEAEPEAEQAHDERRSDDVPAVEITLGSSVMTVTVAATMGSPFSDVIVEGGGALSSQRARLGDRETRTRGARPAQEFYGGRKRRRVR